MRRAEFIKAILEAHRNPMYQLQITNYRSLFTDHSLMKRLLISLNLLLILLASCAPATPPPTQDMSAALTQAFGTAIAELQPTPTPLPTGTPVPHAARVAIHVCCESNKSVRYSTHVHPRLVRISAQQVEFHQRRARDRRDGRHVPRRQQRLGG
jgi:hypothetical protein